MSWKHICALTLGCAVAVVGVLTGTAAVLLPLSTTIVGGALGHAMQPTPGQ